MISSNPPRLFKSQLSLQLKCSNGTIWGGHPLNWPQTGSRPWNVNLMIHSLTWVLRDIRLTLFLVSMLPEFQYNRRKFYSKFENYKLTFLYLTWQLKVIDINSFNQNDESEVIVTVTIFYFNNTSSMYVCI